MRTTVANSKIIPYFAHFRVAKNHTGSLWSTDHYQGAGIFPTRSVELPRDAEYYVYSYATPIAWVKDGQWHVPDVKYSPTTTYHQSCVAAAANSSQRWDDPARQATPSRRTSVAETSPLEFT